MIDRFETGKDTAQEIIESGAQRAGNIATIVTGAVRDVTRELGEFATDIFEMREASRRAAADRARAEGVEGVE